MRRDGVLIQYAEGRLHEEMLALTAEAHRAYADRHGFDLWQLMVPGPLMSIYGWWRWALIRKALVDDGYEHAIYLETDVLIVGDSTDLRDATKERPLAMVYGGDYPHHQCGVVYARRDPRVIEFIDRIMDQTPTPDIPVEEKVEWPLRKHCQQTVVQPLLEKRPELCTKLDLKWNTYMRGDDAIVHAWHGTGNEKRKLELMVEAIKGISVSADAWLRR